MATPFANGSRDEEFLALFRDIRDLLTRIDSKLDRLSSPHTPSKDVSHSTEDLSVDALQDRLISAQEEGDPYAVLDLRQALAPHLTEEDRENMDSALARWFTHHFHHSLRAGQAIAVAGALERAVELLGSRPEMQMLADSLPLILRSVGILKEVRQEELED